ncbi:sugar phosphate isomerase/epimerase [Paenibacillus sp. KQZ6P-2]|uniref:Sugar phosphate isomerase/epimerase n=1 Tax=Paenibacillus mangrovi TaxID=2931978 RepID=A0A9X1WW05_9BACL|nr:sugar phosphate isomerase/epimerase family protein [Paenibacillus mangrovi]MCJ8014920.1 sugar phosphate isomerase/epimerase [Paenibacillus mangrovi]
MENIALQLYSIKELTSTDLLGTLKKVADIGYDGVEFAGYFGTSAAELRNALDSYGLRAAGSHIGISDLTQQLDQTIEYSLTIGSPYIICPGLPEEMRESADSYKRTAEQLDRIGERCKEQGIRFGYHNHGVEFLKFEGLTGLEWLTQYTDPDHLFLELDTYWAEHAGFRSVDWIEAFKERCRILHIKDMKSEQDKRNIEIGSGIMDFVAITEAGKRYGVEWYTVEQEEFDIPQLDSIGASLRYLRQIL